MVVLDGRNLTIEKVRNIARGEKVKISPGLWKKVLQAEKFVNKHIGNKKAIYGINTGFGALARVRIGLKDLIRLQRNILLSHNAGVDRPFSKEFVRAAMAIRINTLIQGYSGVSCELIKNLVTLLNKDIIPIVPRKGSVGASGDLAPMASIGLILLGKGKVFYKGKIISASRGLKLAGIKRLTLKPKEGLSLLNGTQFSTGIAALINYEARRLCEVADIAGAISIDGLRGSVTPFSPHIFRVRPHPGAVKSAKRIRRLLKGSAILRSHKNCSKVQDAYSLRCMAQVHGAVWDLLEFARKTVEIELNAITDNPLIFTKNNTILSGGNFHAEPIAFALDIMTMALTELSSISERRTFRLLDSDLSGINSFLTPKPGVNSGLMMAQITAASLVSYNKTLSFPGSVDSIPTSADQEDHVSMSMNAGLKALEVLENTKYVLAIELLCGTQALDLLRPLRSSRIIENIKRKIRKEVSFISSDRPLTPEIEKIKAMIEKEQIQSLISI